MELFLNCEIVSRRNNAVEVIAPAKVNLRLEVRGLREDGFHELSTVMMAVDLTDRLRIEARDTPGIELSVSDPALLKDNIVSRTWKMFADHTCVCGGVRVDLSKSIPAAAGLGGGSSDAAGALVGFNELFDTKLDAATLADLGGRLGSDVPFFFAAGSLALCRGRGELIELIDSPGRPIAVIVVPPLACHTAAVYAEYDKLVEPLRRGPAVSAMEAFAGDVDAWPAAMSNDLDFAALGVEPRLREVRTFLETLSPAALVMTGSGSGMFCLCRDASGAAEIERAVNARRLGTAYVVRRWRAATGDG